MKKHSLWRTLVLSLVLLFTATTTIYAQDAQPQPKDQTQATPQVKETKNKECLCEVLKKLKELTASLEALKKTVADQQKQIADQQKQIDDLSVGQDGEVSVLLQGTKGVSFKNADSADLFTITLEPGALYKIEVTGYAGSVDGGARLSLNLKVPSGVLTMMYTTLEEKSYDSFAASYWIDGTKFSAPEQYTVSTFTDDTTAFGTYTYDVIQYKK
ncbi:hypothetical protein GE107_13445 [Cohnella sp. CFH 77786]|uniref:hypothetical protein n=1 Tax=Cohnella sp. CFH 77786 TaxID=2662265 RepID=UPI001C61006A|nr:hypothetical protein [Cohnella sp. CFH 77786]MBW5447068.1 hypothetical protein [Cohnella sp. CFH 77786]